MRLLLLDGPKSPKIEQELASLSSPPHPKLSPPQMFPKSLDGTSSQSVAKARNWQCSLSHPLESFLSLSFSPLPNIRVLFFYFWNISKAHQLLLSSPTSIPVQATIISPQNSCCSLLTVLPVSIVLPFQSLLHTAAPVILFKTLSGFLPSLFKII